MKIQDMQQAEAQLAKYVPLVSQLPGEQMTLERIKPLMQMLGNPQDKIRVIHIAGTSGKTSTAYYIAGLLSRTGKKTGLTVSPHINDVRERVQIDLEPINPDKFCEYLGLFLYTLNQLQTPPTYFELLYAFAIWVFEQEQVDYAVVETGMGGLYDATNVVTAQNKICVITDIGLDHTHILGDTVEKIASQKAGIIHQGNEVFMLEQSKKVNMLINQHCSDHNAVFHLLIQPRELENIQISGYRFRNFYLAYEVFNFIKNRDNLSNLTSEAIRSISEITIPARMEQLQIGDKHFVIDGAHNLQKLRSFIDSYKLDFPNKQPTVIFALKDGKDCEPFLELLLELGGELIATSFYATQDLPIQSIDPGQIVESLPNLNIRPIPNHIDLIDYIKHSNGREFVITGSFYLISQLKPKLLKTLSSNTTN